MFSNKMIKVCKTKIAAYICTHVALSFKEKKN